MNNELRNSKFLVQYSLFIFFDFRPRPRRCTDEIRFKQKTVIFILSLAHHLFVSEGSRVNR